MVTALVMVAVMVVVVSAVEKCAVVVVVVAVAVVVHLSRALRCKSRHRAASFWRGLAQSSWAAKSDQRASQGRQVTGIRCTNMKANR